jgi:hypothetical protein
VGLAYIARVELILHMNNKNNRVYNLFIEKLEYPRALMRNNLYGLNLSSYVGVLALHCKLKEKILLST